MTCTPNSHPGVRASCPRAQGCGRGQPRAASYAFRLMPELRQPQAQGPLPSWARGSQGPEDPHRRLEEPLSSHKGSSYGGDLSPDRNVNSCAQNSMPPSFGRVGAYNLHVPQTGFSEISQAPGWCQNIPVSRRTNESKAAPGAPGAVLVREWWVWARGGGEMVGNPAPQPT